MYTGDHDYCIAMPLDNDCVRCNPMYDVYARSTDLDATVNPNRVPYKNDKTGNKTIKRAPDNLIKIESQCF